MLENPKFFKIRIRNWWYFFFFLQLSLLLFMIGSLSSSKWVYTNIDTTLKNLEFSDLKNNVFRGTGFAGSLSKCTSSCDEDWKSLSENWCSYYQHLDRNASTSIVAAIKRNPAKSICSLFRALWFGLIGYVFFELLSMVFLVCWAVSMLYYMKKVEKCLIFSFVFCGFMLASHFAGFIFYVVSTRSSFQGDCRDFESDGMNPKVCAADGPALGLFVAVVLPLVCLWFCVVGCVVRKKYGVDAFHEKLEKDNVNTEAKLDISNYSVENAQNNPHDIKEFKI